MQSPRPSPKSTGSNFPPTLPGHARVGRPQVRWNQVHAREAQMAAGGPGPSPPGGKSRVEGRGAAGGLGTLSCPAPAGPPPAGARRTSPRALPCRPLAPRRGGSRERRAETAPSAMSAAGLSESDSGGRPDSCQTVPACPLPPLRKGLRENFQRGRGPEPTPRLGPRDSGSPEGVKKFAQLGHWARRGRGACPAAGGGRGSPVPRRERARPGWGWRR